MKKKRKFYHGAINHVYQRTIDGVHLFYCREDCLVFFTILSVCARNDGVKVLELCLMHNHIHILIEADTLQRLSHFVDHYTAWFVREYNTFTGRTGKLFKKNFGSAPKWEEKRLRSAIIYIGNNPVEKHFCRKAAESRWNFLAYGFDASPFSEPLVKRKASHELKKTLKEVETMVALNLPLKYSQLIRLAGKLSVREREQFTDYVISQYSVIDHKGLVSYFKSYDAMLAAMSVTTGDDYDIKERRDDFSLESFSEMTEYLQGRMERYEIGKVVALPLDAKVRLCDELQKHTNATCRQICKFLHIREKREMQTLDC